MPGAGDASHLLTSLVNFTVLLGTGGYMTLPDKGSNVLLLLCCIYFMHNTTTVIIETSDVRTSQIMMP